MWKHLGFLIFSYSLNTFFVIKQKNSNYHHYALTISPNSPEDLNAHFMAGFHKTVGIPDEKHILSRGINLLKYG